MRGILLNWLTEVSADFNFKRDTYYLSINYIDRYLSKKPGVILMLLGSSKQRLPRTSGESHETICWTYPRERRG